MSSKHALGGKPATWHDNSVGSFDAELPFAASRNFNSVPGPRSYHVRDDILDLRHDPFLQDLDRPSTGVHNQPTANDRYGGRPLENTDAATHAFAVGKQIQNRALTRAN
jgi:hypothetical protein